MNIATATVATDMIYKDQGFSSWVAASDETYQPGGHTSFQNVFHFIRKETMERDLLMERGILRLSFGFLKVSPKTWIRHVAFLYERDQHLSWIDPSFPALTPYTFIELKRMELDDYLAALREELKQTTKPDLTLTQTYQAVAMAFQEAAKLQEETILPTKLTPQFLEPLLARLTEEERGLDWKTS